MRVQIFRHIKFRRAVADLTVTDKLLVDKQIEAGRHAVKVEQDPLGKPFGQRERAAVMPAGVFIRHVGRIDHERIPQVAVKRRIVAAIGQHLPAQRHGDRLFKRAVQKVILHVFKTRIPAKIPFAAERNEAVGRLAAALQGASLIGKRDKIAARLLTADVQRVQIFMINRKHVSTSFTHRERRAQCVRANDRRTPTCSPP